MKVPQTVSAHSVGASTNSYFLSFQQGYRDAPLLVYLPGLDETGSDLISLQTASFENDFNVRSLVIPADDLDDWDKLTAATIALTKAELRKLPEQMPVYLCAESFGGCLALKILQEDQTLFDRVVLVNPASSFHRVPWLNLGSWLFRLVPEPFYKFSTNFSLPFLAETHRLSAEARRALLNSTRSAPKTTLQRRLTMMSSFSIDEAQLRRLNRPVLLIGSRADRILPSVDEVKRLAQIFPQARVVILPHSGHACLIENGMNLEKMMRAENFVD